MKNLNIVRKIIIVLVTIAAVLSAIFIHLPEDGAAQVTHTMLIILNAVASVIFLMYFVFEMLRGRITFGRTMRFAGITSLAAAASFMVGLLVTYASSKGAGLDFHFLKPVEENGSEDMIMIVTSVVMSLIIMSLYLKGRGDCVRSALTSMRSSAAYSAANKYALTSAYATLLLHFVISVSLLVIFGKNELFFVPLACGAFALALWRATGLKLFLPAAVYLIVFHGLEILCATAAELTIGVFAILLANASLDLLLVLALSDLYLTSKK